MRRRGGLEERGRRGRRCEEERTREKLLSYKVIQGGVSGVAKDLCANGGVGAASSRAELGLHLRVRVIEAVLDDKVDWRARVKVSEQIVKVVVEVRILQ